MKELLAAAVEAVEAMEVEYPELTVNDDRRYDVATADELYNDLFEEYDLVEGIEVGASTGASSSVGLRLDVFPGREEANGFHTSYKRNIQGEPVEVPGWADTAVLQATDESDSIYYYFVYGPAVVRVGLTSVPFDSREEAGAELGTVLDIVHASLEETVPLPE